MFTEHATRRFVLIAIAILVSITTVNTVVDRNRSASIVDAWNESAEATPPVRYRSTVILVERQDDGTLTFERVLADTTTEVAVTLQEPVPPVIADEPVEIKFTPVVAPARALIDTTSDPDGLPTIMQTPVREPAPADSVSKYVWRRWLGIPYKVERVTVKQ